MTVPLVDRTPWFEGTPDLEESYSVGADAPVGEPEDGQFRAVRPGGVHDRHRGQGLPATTSRLWSRNRMTGVAVMPWTMIEPTTTSPTTRQTAPSSMNRAASSA